MTVVLTKEYMEGATARAIPGAFFDRDSKAWVLEEPTPKAAMVALKLFPTLAADYPQLAVLRDSLAGEVRPYNNAETYNQPIDAGHLRERLREQDMDLYDYQSVDMGYCADVLRQHGACYVGHERGLGKTLEACALIDDLDFKRVLVVGPNTSKLSVWKPELEKFLPWANVVVLRNSAGQRRKDLDHVKQLAKYQPDKLLIFIVHYEALDIIAGDTGRGWKSLPEWDTVICDEAHRLANIKTKMHRALMKVPTKTKIALSGSIISNHAEDLYGPLRWLYPDRYKSRWRDFNDRFIEYVDGRWGKLCVGIKPERLADLQKELGVFMVYRRKADCLDLPAKTEQTLYVELSKGQRKVYNELIEDSMAELPDGTLLKAEEGLTLLGRLRQVATGLSLVTGEDFADSSKLDLAVELIKDSEEPTVVFSWFKAGARELARRLEAQGIETFTVTGDTPHAQRAEFIRDFQSGQHRVFIGTLSTLGESVTLHRASQAIFLDRSWNPSTNDQAADRIYRIGQVNAVTIVHIIAKGTVDEFRVQPIIEDKAALRRLILAED